MEFEEAIRRTEPTEDVTFEGVDISEYHLHEVNFSKCSFIDCNFNAARISNSSFVNCSFRGCSFQDAVFTDCAFCGDAEDSGSRWVQANLADVEFKKCNLSHNTMAGGAAFRARFVECKAVGIKFSAEVYRPARRRIGAVTFSHCAMMFSAFGPGDYRDCIFEHCDLRDCDFSESNCANASFFSSNLNNARFLRSNLDGANLARAQIEGFQLTDLSSYTDITLSRDQHEQVLKSLSIQTFD
ncbi:MULTISPECIES: pentapeptide repeat-containing protein [Hyphomicrobiales]|uniref:pentapeptide repeat-containing protein n=1 Tax=Hyphomicrobiales TaxID=356 RepID=UPI001F58E8C9|nr:MULTISPECIES: pentapeptide repeat-containing protein [Hyphomicrobiales]MCR8492649.1 pentapeptide repeat-containing protein [Brucella anthropi]